MNGRTFDEHVVWIGEMLAHGAVFASAGMTPEYVGAFYPRCRHGKHFATHVHRDDPKFRDGFADSGHGVGIWRSPC